MKIYIVRGHTGEYSDHRDWPVCAVSSEDGAKALVTRLEAKALELGIRHGSGASHTYPVTDRPEIRAMREFDPGVESVDYTGLFYDYESTLLVLTP